MHREAYVVVVIGYELEEPLVVLLYKLPLPRSDVNAVEVVKLGVSVVEPESGYPPGTWG